MKQLLFSIGILILFSFSNESQIPMYKGNDGVSCMIKSKKRKYNIGEVPEITVEIKNKSSNKIYLIGSLDGSDIKMRYPYCYFTIEKPTEDKLQFARCGNTNSLECNDFVKIERGDSFNPFREGFFSAYEIKNKLSFKMKGKYRIRFLYSTESSKIEDYLGDGKPSEQLYYQFNRIEHLKLESNIIEIEFE